ncbi:hypothetical protein C8R43DRAFT_933110 [Mycena crocata]|nr:hypothetical protein C8R43DRAFT_933110 [Mycena crocata]
MNFLSKSFVPKMIRPEQEVELSPGLGNHSMIIGGSVMYLKPDEPWPTCNTCQRSLVPLVQINVSSESTPEAFRSCFPSAVAPGGPLATMLQLFICPDSEEGCFEESSRDVTDPSWLVRIATVPLSADSDANNHVAEGRPGAESDSEDGPGFLAAHIVEGWQAGIEETILSRKELAKNWGVSKDRAKELYAAHRPREGWKLLGHSVWWEDDRGEVDCFQGGDGHDHPSWRELIQIGEFELVMLYNVWIAQCIHHPECVTLMSSGPIMQDEEDVDEAEEEEEKEKEDQWQEENI